MPHQATSAEETGFNADLFIYLFLYCFHGAQWSAERTGSDSFLLRALCIMMEGSDNLICISHRGFISF